MPKAKSSRGAAKRFRLTATGKIRRWRSSHGHLLTKKSPKRKRRLRSTTMVAKVDEKRIKKVLVK